MVEKKKVDDKKKQQEQKCYDTTREFVEKKLNNKSRRYFISKFPIDSSVTFSEGPDFIINTDKCSYLIEHFMIDICYDGPKNNQSQSKRASRYLYDIYNEFHDPEIGTIRDEKMHEATAKIEKGINNLTNIANLFNYDKYIAAFKRTFEEHYRKIPNYKNNSNVQSDVVIVGFLIELRFVACNYYALKNGAATYFDSKNKVFPMTRHIMEILDKSRELDFVIVSQYDEGISTTARDVKIYDPQSLEESISIQRIKVFDKVCYRDIKSNLHLTLKD